ncbi:MAG: ACT domain-containing protein [Clostridia bacterium]|nr:ACT domain-containing protein [Clostridia bacterium]
MRVVVSVIGHDQVGILAKVTEVCAKHNANVIDVTQSVLQEFFAMIMLVDVEKTDVSLQTFKDEMDQVAKEKSLSIHVMHEDIFNAMHTV